MRQQRTAIRSQPVHEHVRIWQFYNAPPEFRELSTNGGDEDWLVHVPASMVDVQMLWLELGIINGWFGCSSVDDYALPDGSKIYIGAHA